MNAVKVLLMNKCKNDGLNYINNSNVKIDFFGPKWVTSKQSR